MNINFSTKIYLILILVFSILIVWPLFLPGYFFHHDDLQVMRVFEMRKCLDDLQIPCRWVPDMGYGNGYPLYNYYSALPYYIGGVLSFFLSFVDSAKVLFFIPLVLGGISMFLLAKELFGKEAGFLSGILYMFAPYRALDAWVRGAVAESFALSIIPLVFYFNLKLIQKPSRSYFIYATLSFSAFLLSHNIMTMFFLPFLILWNLIFLFFNKWKNLKTSLSSFFLAIGLSAFFLLPIFLEKDLVQTETLIIGGGDFRAHFVTVYQLFLDRFWGYGGSEFGPGDTISFQIGWPLWWFIVIAVPILIFTFKKNLQKSILGIFFLLMFLISIFMTHNKSAFVWEALSFLAYAQFPWRFLSLSIFSSSLLAGFCFYYLKHSLKAWLIWAIVILTIFLNWSYFQPRDFYPWINDKNKLADPLWEIEQKAGILDYLPKTAYEPRGRAPDKPEIIRGNAETSNYNVKSNSFSFKASISKNAYLEIPIFDFPNWTVFVNGKQFPHDHINSIGRIGINLTPGQYEIKGIFKDTWVRTVGNFLTLLSFLILMIITFNRKIYKNEH